MLMSLRQHVSEFTSTLISPAQDNENRFVEKIKESSKISPQLAIDIYRNNTRGARINALMAVYPACKNILGNDIFQSIAKEYVSADVIGSSDLNHYGETFNQHLGLILNAGRLPAEYHYLPDLARLEFLLHTAYYADDDPVFDFELFEFRVENRQPIYLQASASLGLLAFQNPIHEIWMNNYREIKNGNENVQAITEKQYLLIHRDEYTPVVVAINYCEYQLIDAFINKRSLQAAIDSIDCVIDCNLDVILPNIIAKKWIVGVK